MKILFKNAKILDFDQSDFISGNVEITDSIITNVGSFDICTNYDRVIDCRQNILMPGFIDTHCHTPMTLLRSINDDTHLHEWLFDYVLPTEAKLSPEDVYWGEYLGVLESIRGGITTIDEGYFHNKAICEVINASGIRARIGIGPAIRNKGISNTAYLEQSAREIKNSDLISTCCFVHSVYTIN